VHRYLLVPVAAAVLLLASCGNEAAPGNPAVPETTQTAAVKTSAAARATAANLPPAPPLDSWVVKGSDYQLTLDLNMQTAMIELGLSPSDIDESDAQAYAYHVCSTLRNNPDAGYDVLVTDIYPSAELTKTLGMVLAAQHYCLDTVTVS
jgi:hypothetical protein